MGQASLLDDVELAGERLVYLERVEAGGVQVERDLNRSGVVLGEQLSVQDVGGALGGRQRNGLCFADLLVLRSGQGQRGLG